MRTKKAERKFAKRVAKEKYGEDIPDFLEFAPSTLWIVEEVNKDFRAFSAFETRPQADAFIEWTESVMPGWTNARILGRYVWYVAEEQAPKKGKKR